MTGIVVGVDGSESSELAIEWAVHEAELRALPLTAVLAWGWFGHQKIVGERFNEGYDDADAAAALDAFIQESVGRARAVRVARHAVCDLAGRALLKASVHASLLVVGGRGAGGFHGLRLGSVSQQCLHHANCPVVVVRQDGQPSKGPHRPRVVVGVDGSVDAKRALAWAAEEAHVREASLEVVHAWSVPYVDAYPYAAPSLDPGVFEEAGARTLDAAVDSIDTTGLALPVERILANGEPASVIVDGSKGADLVVLGSRGRGHIGGLLLGSVSQHVAHHATCPVVIVPPEA